MPPQSPVAWSSFTTGLEPARHGIFDFVHRDPADDGAVPVDDEDEAAVVDDPVGTVADCR